MRSLCLVAVAIASGLAGTLAAKLHTRWMALCGNGPYSYVQIRLAIIHQAIASREGGPTYLVIGDSLTEIGRWPAMCGHRPVATGVSGARSDTWFPHAKGVADALRPGFVVLALGTNDVLTQGRLGPYERSPPRSPVIASLPSPCTALSRHRYDFVE